MILMTGFRKRYNYVPFEMLHQLNLAIIFLTCLSPNLANDFYAKFSQKDYKVDFQRVILVDYEKPLFNFVKIKTFKYNRTLPALNLTLSPKINIGSKLEVIVQAFKLLSNEYRELRGTRFQINCCTAIKTNLVGLQSLLRCGNFTACLVLEGRTYEACNAYPDESRFPSFVPNGEYKAQLEFVYLQKIIMTVDMYFKVYRPIAV